MGFSRQQYWSGLPCPPPGDLPDLGLKLSSLMSPALAGTFFTTEPPGKPKSARLLCPWNSPGKNPGVGCHSLFQGIFPTLGSNPGLLHCRQILYLGSPMGRMNFDSAAWWWGWVIAFRRRVTSQWCFKINPAGWSRVEKVKRRVKCGKMWSCTREGTQKGSGPS